jgi:hypothetical protein
MAWIVLAISVAASILLAAAFMFDEPLMHPGDEGSSVRNRYETDAALEKEPDSTT